MAIEHFRLSAITRATCSSTDAIGVDIGLMELSTLSDGTTKATQQFYRDLEPALVIAQWARKAQRVKALHARIANRRKDFLHKRCTELVRSHPAIFIDDVSIFKSAKTGMAKSDLDAGWIMFRTMLQYQGDSAGSSWVREVNEAYSTQECSICHACSGLTGVSGLAVRHWNRICGTVHDRDTNAAENIKQHGLPALEKEFRTSAEEKAYEPAVSKAPNPEWVFGAEVKHHHLPAQGILIL